MRISLSAFKLSYGGGKAEERAEGRGRRIMSFSVLVKVCHLKAY
jgi:hypothetical protein